jgi:hypothetical protein
VLNEGRIIGQGTPDEVLGDPAAFELTLTGLERGQLQRVLAQCEALGAHVERAHPARRSLGQLFLELRHRAR